MKVAEAGEGSVPPLLGASNRPPRAGAWRYLLGIGAGVAVAVGFWVLHTFPPDGNGLYPKCGFHSWTGWSCPGCGSTRALHHLTHGRVLVALRSNALLTLGLPLGLAWVGFRRWFGGRTMGGMGGRPTMDWVRWMPWLAVLLVVFGIVRNLPWPPFTYLSP